MRFTSWLGPFALILLGSPVAHAADTPPDVRTVIVPQAQVWCGPSTSDGLYPTNVLRQGDRVQVEHELESGWLAIRPPAGSFSWINDRFVQHMTAKYANYVVTHEQYPVPVFIGSSFKTDRPNKIGVKLPRGAQVQIFGLGQPMKDEEGVWLPIVPPEGEVRYLRKENVAKPGTPPSGVVAATASAKPATPPPPPDGDTLWRDAEKAERTGRTSDAIRLYRMAGDANLSVNPSRADEAYRRAHWLEQAQPGRSSPGSYYYPDRNAQTSGTSSPYSLPTYQGGNNAFQTIGSASPGTTNAQLVSAQPGETYVRGRLQPSFKNEAIRRYYLLDNRGQPTIAVIAGPGVDLSSYQNHTIELWGYTHYDAPNRINLLTATHVREAQ